LLCPYARSPSKPSPLVNLVRNVTAGRRVAADVAEEFGLSVPPEVEHLDLGSLASVRAFAASFVASHRPLHLLVLNAGVALYQYSTTVDGFEAHMGVNHLGHFLLTDLLKDALAASAPSRVVALTSGLHHMTYTGGIDPSKFTSGEGFDGLRAYGHSKLANILMIQELAERLRGRGVYCNAAHPGVVKSEISRHFEAAKPLMTFGWMWQFLSDWALMPARMDTEVGALTPLYAATHPDIERLQVSGAYFVPIARRSTPSAHARNATLQRMLWSRAPAVSAVAELLG